MKPLMVAMLVAQGAMGEPVQNEAQVTVAKPKFPPSETVPPPCFHLYMIYFDSGSTALSGQGKAILDTFAYPLVKHNIRSRVIITARTDTVGKAADNRRLALRRGQKVQEYLLTRGMDPALIEIVPEGESQMYVPTPDETPEKLNRFVNVREEPTPEEMERRRRAWADFSDVAC